jgi:hypothetical protein
MRFLGTTLGRNRGTVVGILGPLAAFALACGGSGGGGPSGGSGEEDPGLVAGSSGGDCIPLPIRDPDVGLPPDIGTRIPGTIDPDPDPELTRDPDFVLPPKLVIDEDRLFPPDTGTLYPGLPPNVGTRAPGTIDPDPDPELTRDPDFVLPPDVETRDPGTLRPDLDPIKGLPYCK